MIRRSAAVGVALLLGVGSPGIRSGRVLLAVKRNVQARLVVQHFGGYPGEGTARNQVGLPGGLHNLEFRLARDQQPIHRRIQVVVIRVADLQLFGQAGCMPVPRRTELGAGKDHLLHNHAHHQVAFSAKRRPATGPTTSCRIMSSTAWTSLYSLERMIRNASSGETRFSSGVPAGGVESARREGATGWRGSVLDRAVLAVAFPQQHGRWGRTVGNDGYVHADIIRAINQ